MSRACARRSWRLPGAALPMAAGVSRWPCSGRQAARAGRHSVRRLMREMGLAIKPKRGRGSGTDSRHSLGRYPNLIKGIQPERPNQVWVADITYVRVGSEFVYLAVIMDVFTRSVRGWHISWTAGQSLTLAALRKALEHHPAPEFHHSAQARNMPPKPTSSCCAGAARRSAWQPPASPRKTAMPSG